MSAQLATLLQPIITAVVGAILVWVANAVRTRVRNQNALTLIDTIGRAVEAAVAKQYQTRVKDLKDPSKPGAWDEAAQEQARFNVMHDVVSAVGPSSQQLAAMGFDVSAIVRAFTEQAVLAQKNGGAGAK